MDFLDAEKIPFDDRDVTRNPKFAREVAEKSGRYKSPTLDIDGEILADTDIEEVAAYLKLIGYQLHAA